MTDLILRGVTWTVAAVLMVALIAVFAAVIVPILLVGGAAYLLVGAVFL